MKNHFNLNADAIAHAAGVVCNRVLEATDAGPQPGVAPQVLMVAPAPVSAGECPFWHLFDCAAGKSAHFGRAYAEIATAFGLPFLDAGQYASAPVPDTIHICAESCAKLGAAVAGKVREIFG